ncbi:S-layer homology domain-containing protein [Paenibacillus thailandensis]|uniref:S-layer homology domain-containing protein n=1 Tax=Paenibacillus thailandensis TaxID=393250 RepID=A0ABW5R3W8_9BACL
MKKFLSITLALSMLLTIVLPQFLGSNTAAAAGSYFIFPNEKSDSGSPRVTSNERVTLEGSINNVLSSSITYSIYQVTVSGGKETVVSSLENQTDGMTFQGQSITVEDLDLFPGLNKITFKGTSGSSTVSESIYIEYRNSPMLYDLFVTFENEDFAVREDGTTVLYATESQGETEAEVIFSGKALNADSVTITVNNDNSYDFNVYREDDEYTFTSSILRLDAGMNEIKFSIKSDGQTIDTVRKVAFYNGEITYYDLAISDTDGNSAALASNLNFSTDITDGSKKVRFTGSAIVPVSYDSSAGTAEAYLSALLSSFKYSLKNKSGNAGNDVNWGAGSVTSDVKAEDLTENTDYITVSFTFEIASSLLFGDNNYSVQFVGRNDVEDEDQYSNAISFFIQSNATAYIYDVNYLSGYDSTAAESPSVLNNLQGSDLENAYIYSVPAGVEVLIGNYSKLPTDNSYANLVQVTGAASYKQLAHYQVVYRTVNNVSTPFLRLFIEIGQFNSSTGSNTLTFKLNGTSYSGQVSTATKTATITLLYGPYVKFDSISDDMNVSYDTTVDNLDKVIDDLGDFTGKVYNITNPNELVYSADVSAGNSKTQTVFLYVNNVEIPLKATDTSKTTFTMDTKPSTDFIIYGENIVEFYIYTSKNNYKSVLTVNVVPTNLPVIPVEGTSGVFPYSNDKSEPVANDPNFQKEATKYTTTEAYMNVYGTFDFIDLGKTETAIDDKLDALDTKQNNYILKVQSDSLTSDIEWNLSNKFTAVKDGKTQRVFNGDNEVSSGGVEFEVYYDMSGQYFYFIIEDQEMPEDGSSVAFVFTVYNSGTSGPSASYRLEVDPVAIPYTILAPVSENRITNKDYVEVIIASPGAESIVINKQTAEKVQYIDYGNNEEHINAFRVLIKDLKANKDNKIEFEITRGTDTTEGEFTVSYQPTNIPGAQSLKTMGKSHKVFNNTVTLTFPSNTKLVRPNYNEASDYVTGIYSGNDLLFAIANPEDGIIDRHEFESKPSKYTSSTTNIGEKYMTDWFEDQAQQFIKVSPLIWIDGGLADDENTTAYDPVTRGMDPFPFPLIDGDPEDYYTTRDDELELVPSAAGELTLTYDANISSGAGTQITVFYFDPYEKVWENIGGVVDSKKNTITTSFRQFGYYIVGKLSTGFNDINNHSYAREAMEAIFTKGVMNAVDPDDEFGANNYVTRGEFTRMIVRMLDLPLNYEGDLTFIYSSEARANAKDPESLYDYRYIETAARAGLVRGTSPGQFSESSRLTRQDAAVILANALELKLETDAKKANDALAKAFKDSTSADYYAVPSILAIYKKGYIQGSAIDSTNPKAGYVFEPTARLLRSDAAIIVAKVMADLKKMPKIYAN